MSDKAPDRMPQQKCQECDVSEYYLPRWGPLEESSLNVTKFVSPMAADHIISNHVT